MILRHLFEQNFKILPVSRAEDSELDYTRCRTGRQRSCWRTSVTWQCFSTICLFCNESMTS